DESFADVVWSHPQPPEHAAVMTDLLAFSWSEMDAFYEEDEPIFGHAADPYHRVDVRASGRRLTSFSAPCARCRHARPACRLRKRLCTPLVRAAAGRRALR